jgi:hypothetical protein
MTIDALYDQLIVSDIHFPGVGNATTGAKYLVEAASQRTVRSLH